MHNDYTFQCFIDNIVKKKKILAPISLFHLFLNCKINPKAVVNSHTFVVVCSFVTVVRKTQTCIKLNSVAFALRQLKRTHPYQIITQCKRTSLFGYT